MSIQLASPTLVPLCPHNSDVKQEIHQIRVTLGSNVTATITMSTPWQLLRRAMPSDVKGLPLSIPRIIDLNNEELLTVSCPGTRV